MTSETAPGPRRLLAVDDNRLILRVVADFFTPHGWSVTQAVGVPAAREALARELPDAIVSDILMPEVDGWVFFEELRRDPKTASIPFIFLTVEGDLPQRLRGLHLGADDYMTKPFDVEELLVRVTRLVERRATLDRARHGGEALLAGSVEHLAISDLLQILSLNGKDGTVALVQGAIEGRIEFVSGQIVHAVAGSARGPKALFRMLGWTGATFRVLPRSEAPEARSISGSTSNVLMDGLVSLDEWARWKESLPDEGARLAMTPEARDKLHGHNVTPAEFDLLARAKTGVTVARALEESPHPDAEIAEAISTLIARGILEAGVEDERSPSVSMRGAERPSRL